MERPDQTARAFDPDLVRTIADGMRTLEGPLLPILHALSERFGHVDPRAVPIVADVLNLSRAEVHGVVSFYPDFRREPPRRHVVKVCRAEACQAVGGRALHAALESAAAAATDLTVEPVYCLGNCALGPAALVDGELRGRLDPASVLEQLGR